MMIGRGKEDTHEDFAKSSQIYRQAEKASGGLLSSELEHALEKCKRAPLTKNTSGIRQWFNRDTIQSVLKDVEKQITSCFNEFTALTAVRIERKLGDHNAQVNRKLDELLRRSSGRPHSQLPKSTASKVTSGVGGNQTHRTRFDSKPTYNEGRGGSLDLPRTRDMNMGSFVKPPQSVDSSASRNSSTIARGDRTFNISLPTENRNRRVIKRKPPPVIRSDTTATSTSSVSSSSPSSPTIGSVPTVSIGMTRAGALGTHVRARSHPVLSIQTRSGSENPDTRTAATIPIPASPTSFNFPPSSPHFTTLSTPTLVTSFAPNKEHIALFSQANDLDAECRRLRSLHHPSEALTVARNAVNLRRAILAMNHDCKNITALARSLMYVGRCLRDLYVGNKTGSPPGRIRRTNSHGAEKLGEELLSIWTECAELYREAFREDKSLRVELATVLYNLSAKLSQPTHGELPDASVTAPPMTAMTSVSSLGSRDAALSRNRAHELDLEAALDAAEEAVHHFTVLEHDEPEMYSMDLANAQLNLSFILSDLSRGDKALAVARKAVILSYRLTLTDPHTEGRVRIMRTLHKSLMRVSYCLRDLGKKHEAAEAEAEANGVMKAPFFALGS
ncbi:hypothetical protein VKT23_000313 [Stygiomarasmius scandens]|uniref:Uncharacterized protein n=1 Tax=Marasmiellus scandens TaxID=2682957 RepID=A0ABR1K5L5_9AGAR